MALDEHVGQVVGEIRQLRVGLDRIVARVQYGFAPRAFNEGDLTRRQRDDLAPRYDGERPGLSRIEVAKRFRKRRVEVGALNRLGNKVRVIRLVHRRAVAQMPGDVDAQLLHERHVDQVALVALDEHVGQVVGEIRQLRVGLDRIVARVQYGFAPRAFNEGDLTRRQRDDLAPRYDGERPGLSRIEVAKRFRKRRVEVGALNRLGNKVRVIRLVHRRAVAQMPGDVDSE